MKVTIIVGWFSILDFSGPKVVKNVEYACRQLVRHATATCALHKTRNYLTEIMLSCECVPPADKESND